MKKTLVHIYVAAVHSMEFLDRSRSRAAMRVFYLIDVFPRGPAARGSKYITRDLVTG